MNTIGALPEQTDTFILWYLVLGVLVFAAWMYRHMLVNPIGVFDILMAGLMVCITFTFVRSYTLTETRYIQIWRMIHFELKYIRKTYGVVEIRLMFHFLVKRIQLKSFYGNEIEPQLGADVIKLVELWSYLLYRELASFNLDATYRVRVLCLEKAVHKGIHKRE